MGTNKGYIAGYGSPNCATDRCIDWKKINKETKVFNKNKNHTKQIDVCVDFKNISFGMRSLIKRYFGNY